MKRIVYTNRIDNQIISHENHMLAMYTWQIKKYIPIFEKNGYSLKVGLMWKSLSRNNVTFQRENFQNGYQCYVYCVVQKDNKEVQIPSTDGEADYYSLSTAWMVSSIYREFCWLNLSLCVSMDDVDSDLNGFLSQIKHSRTGDGSLS